MPHSMYPPPKENNLPMSCASSSRTRKQPCTATARSSVSRSGSLRAGLHASELQVRGREPSTGGFRSTPGSNAAGKLLGRPNAKRIRKQFSLYSKNYNIPNSLLLHLMSKTSLVMLMPRTYGENSPLERSKGSGASCTAYFPDELRGA